MHEREPDRVGPVWCARREEARLDAVEPWRPDLGLGGDAGIPIEDPEQPDVREGGEPFQRMGGGACARAVFGQDEPELGRNGGHAAARTRRAVLFHEWRNTTDG